MISSPCPASTRDSIIIALGSADTYKFADNGRTWYVKQAGGEGVNTGARLDNKFTYGLGTALGDFDFDLVIPATVRTIGDKALAHCVRLHDVVLGGGANVTRSQAGLKIGDAIASPATGDGFVGTLSAAREHNSWEEDGGLW